MDQYQKVFQSVEKKLAPTLLNKHGLVLKKMLFGDDSVLYMAKPNWTNRFDENRESTIGIFYSLWVSAALLKKQQFKYNVHSKSLAKLPGYTLEPKTFAEQFRKQIEGDVAGWPKISLKHGPSTLFQGIDSFKDGDFAEHIEARIADFVGIHKQIDRLMDKSKAKP